MRYKSKNGGIWLINVARRLDDTTSDKGWHNKTACRTESWSQERTQPCRIFSCFCPTLLLVCPHWVLGLHLPSSLGEKMWMVFPWCHQATFQSFHHLDNRGVIEAALSLSGDFQSHWVCCLLRKEEGKSKVKNPPCFPSDPQMFPQYIFITRCDFSSHHQMNERGDKDNKVIAVQCTRGNVVLVISC